MADDPPDLALAFTPEGWSDFAWWLDEDRQTAKRIRRLAQEALRTPYAGTGKPERLRHQTGHDVWSRRITQEHRLVYTVGPTQVTIIQARFHY